MIYRVFCHFAPIFIKFDPEVTTYFAVFPGRFLGLSYVPLKFSKEKMFLWLLHLNRLMEFPEIK